MPKVKRNCSTVLSVSPWRQKSSVQQIGNKVEHVSLTNERQHVVIAENLIGNSNFPNRDRYIGEDFESEQRKNLQRQGDHLQCTQNTFQDRDKDKDNCDDGAASQCMSEERGDDTDMNLLDQRRLTNDTRLEIGNTRLGNVGQGELPSDLIERARIPSSKENFERSICGRAIIAYFPFDGLIFGSVFDGDTSIPFYGKEYATLGDCTREVGWSLVRIVISFQGNKHPVLAEKCDGDAMKLNSPVNWQGDEEAFAKSILQTCDDKVQLHFNCDALLGDSAAKNLAYKALPALKNCQNQGPILVNIGTMKINLHI